jgi:hypothetical protein
VCRSLASISAVARFLPPRISFPGFASFIFNSRERFLDLARSFGSCFEVLFLGRLLLPSPFLPLRARVPHAYRLSCIFCAAKSHSCLSCVLFINSVLGLRVWTRFGPFTRVRSDPRQVPPNFLVAGSFSFA